MMGSSGQPDWDSEVQGGLPVAILVRIALRAAQRTVEQDDRSMRITNNAPESSESYEMVIDLPNAVPATDASL